MFEYFYSYYFDVYFSLFKLSFCTTVQLFYIYECVYLHNFNRITLNNFIEDIKKD